MNQQNDLPEQQQRLLDGYTVHLAEDEFLNQRLISALLQDSGASVKLSENGRELLQALEENHGDCILMDIQMPVMNGLDATKEIRSTEEQGVPPIPIIAMTAQESHDFQEKCILAGMNAFMTKPVCPGTLINTILKLAVPGALN